MTDFPTLSYTFRWRLSIWAIILCTRSVPDPDLEIRGDRSSRPLDKGGGSLKNNFRPLRALVWSKNKGGGVPLDPPLKNVYLQILFILFRLGTYSSIDDNLLDAITLRASNEHPRIGIRIIQGYLKCNGYNVQRDKIRLSLLRTGPIGVVQKWCRTVRTRHYNVKFPLSLSHLDGNHKLIKYLYF